MGEFKKWIEDIKNLIEKRIKKLAYIWVENRSSNIFDIYVGFFEGQTFWMSFDQTEFNKNSKKQRRTLAKIRRQNLAQQIEDFGKTLIKTANRLK